MSKLADFIIDTKYIEKFNPCQNRWDNYLKYYKDFSGNIVEFLELENITFSDKKWVLFREDTPLPESLMREFALIVACIAAENCNCQEVKDYYDIVLTRFITGMEYDPETYRAADRAAYRAADRAAYSAADWAAYSAADGAADGAAYWAADWAADDAAGKDQLDILINLIEDYNE